MKRDQDPPAEAERPIATDKVASDTTGPLGKQPSAGPRPAAGRRWSARRTPAAITALLIGAAAGTLLFDIVRVRAGQPAAAWRTHLADELATRPLDDVWIQIGAAVLGLLGLWLIVLAVTPGLRHEVPLKTSDGQMRAVMDRDSAALLLRDAAMRVPGVSAARIRVFQHRVKARADVRFRAPADVKADLLAALREELDRLALARPRGLSVRVRPRRK
ncbi:DUF6286 domain-containing protein [Streptomyces sp. MB09-01]|uniref:DUF6286 domain-containing protein n=1 Tax=Streptomyces sp. MB09-01 TaxID=3028666 RepID=UPI0029A83288|nr:DUF6286 domain-containing protein [Streptomyces sp. MB09-01]MDX3537259.1 DUF6286 domain-containing protein [Streptomyces sp. MB09-01]